MIGDELASCVAITREVGIGSADDGVELLNRGVEQTFIFINRVDQGVVPFGVLLDKELQPGLTELGRSSDTCPVRVACCRCVAQIRGGAGRGVRAGQPSLVANAVPEELPVGFAGSRPSEVGDVGRCLGDCYLLTGRGAGDDLADHGEWVKGTGFSVADEAISDTVQRVTGSDNGLCERVYLTFWGEMPGDVHHDLRPRGCRDELGPVESRSCRGDAIIRVRVALGKHEALTATLRAAAPVRVLGGLPIEVADNVLGDDRLTCGLS